jgi:hypothetical protein
MAIHGAMVECIADGWNRSFLARAYPTMKKNNPHTPIMLREAAGTQPRVYARYGQSSIPRGMDLKQWRLFKGEWTADNGSTEFGKEKSESLAGQSHRENGRNDGGT